MLFRFKRHDAVVYKLLSLPHVTSVTFKAVSPGSDTTEAGIGIGAVFEQIPPSYNWKPGCYYSRLSGISGFNDLDQITALIQTEIHQSEIINDKQIICSHLIDVIQSGAAYSCFLQFLQKCIGTDILH